MPPAISFAWEKSESNVMDRPPRNRKVDRLVRPSLLAYCYGQAGLIEAAACLLAYFVVYWTNGITMKDLVDFNTTDAVTLADGRVMPLDQQNQIVSMAMCVRTCVRTTYALSCEDVQRGGSLPCWSESERAQLTFLQSIQTGRPFTPRWSCPSSCTSSSARRASCPCSSTASSTTP